LHIAVSAGHSLHTAVAAVAGSGTGVVIDGLAEVQRRFERGGRLTDELAKLPDRLGPEVQPLSTTLIVAASSGAPLGPTLQRLADAQRRRVRRHTEERVRKLPVLLLAPLITLVLPAFVLLTVVPVAITTARTGLAPIQNSLPMQNSIPLPNTDPVASPP
jgi:pilus assembly protein TadC